MSFALIGELIGGLGLFLLGMSLLTDGLKRAAGPSLKSILRRATESRLRGLFTGAFIISLSRVMCGVHYPFDIAAGALFGILFGMLVIYLWNLFNKRFKILT